MEACRGQNNHQTGSPLVPSENSDLDGHAVMIWASGEPDRRLERVRERHDAYATDERRGSGQYAR